MPVYPTSITFEIFSKNRHEQSKGFLSIDISDPKTNFAQAKARFNDDKLPKLDYKEWADVLTEIIKTLKHSYGDNITTLVFSDELPLKFLSPIMADKRFCHNDVGVYCNLRLMDKQGQIIKDKAA